MKKVTYKLLVSVILSSALFFTSCIHRNFEEPPFSQIATGPILTLQDVEQIYYDSVAPTMRPYKFTSNFSVFAVVTMDDKSGNIYKSAYIQDDTKGMNLRLLSSGGLYQGDSIMLNLNNLVLSSYNGMIQIDSVNVDKNILKIKTKINIEPVSTSIGQVTDWHVGRLVEIENVQFSIADVGTVYAAPNTSENRTLENCNGNTLIVRNSGYANFASEKVPRRRGSIVGIIGKYGNGYQFYIRSIGEVKLTKARCGELDSIFSESFDNVIKNEPISFSNWKNINESGNLKWLGNTLSGGNGVAYIKNENSETSTWLILPQQTISENIAINFTTLANNVADSQLKAMYSLNYDGSENPQNAEWVELPAIIATSLNAVVSSGELDLPQGNIHIAFKFTATATSRAQYFLDDIVIYNKED
ncbi:DUF5689 domain-containing protein [Bacteroidales bacterium OttesenSCG-928-I21]|nr:DUF5689 domain-containing protein [Bacteroidales bacterium OttesenSCG-928-I21]